MINVDSHTISRAIYPGKSMSSEQWSRLTSRFVSLVALSEFLVVVDLMLAMVDVVAQLLIVL
jgi:hypothetical protein